MKQDDENKKADGRSKLLALAEKISNATSADSAKRMMSAAQSIMSECNLFELAAILEAAYASNPKIQDELTAGGNVSTNMNSAAMQKEMQSILGDYSDLFKKKAENDKAMTECFKVSLSFDDFMNAKDPKVALGHLNNVLKAFEPGTLTNHASNYAQQQALLDKELELIKREQALKEQLLNRKLTGQEQAAFKQRVDAVGGQRNDNKAKFVDHTRKILIAGAAKHAVVGDREARAEDTAAIQKAAGILNKSEEVIRLAESKVAPINSGTATHAGFEEDLHKCCKKEMQDILDRAMKKQVQEAALSAPAAPLDKPKLELPQPIINTTDAAKLIPPEVQAVVTAIAQNAGKSGASQMQAISPPQPKDLVKVPNSNQENTPPQPLKATSKFKELLEQQKAKEAAQNASPSHSAASR